LASGRPGGFSPPDKKLAHRSPKRKPGVGPQGHLLHHLPGVPFHHSCRSGRLLTAAQPDCRPSFAAAKPKLGGKRPTFPSAARLSPKPIAVCLSGHPSYSPFVSAPVSAPVYPFIDKPKSINKVNELSPKLPACIGEGYRTIRDGSAAEVEKWQRKRNGQL
jgi:hypothetical protein